ncbi:MAG: Copper amine oxidase domain protein [Microgenomates group bacterium GW2011_GWC2_46_7]|nr:MAG: Copper amine oxidase domain protein [Microgenomates group bacterium GW2011_GWC2_46_7]
MQLYLSFPWRLLIGVYMVAIIGGLGWSWWEGVSGEKTLIAEVAESNSMVTKLSLIAEELEKLKMDDQVVKNASLSAEIDNIAKSYKAGAQLFESRVDLVITTGKVSTVDKELAKFLRLLGERKWKEANEQIGKVESEIEKIVLANVPKVSVPVNAPANNTLPASGYTRQKVASNRGEFVVSAVVAPGAKAIIETLDDPQCVGNCEARTLSEHIAKSGGFAGINGSYFCPPDYAQCQGKTNSFDTLAVNGRNKLVFNRDNNVYSTIPLVAAYNTSLSFYDQSVQWGVDTSGGGAIANFPRLLRDGVEATSEENGKGTRGFVGMKDGAIVIGHIFAASYADAAATLRALGLQNALNLDGGGSSALWFEGSYKVGPGRVLPTAIVLVR